MPTTVQVRLPGLSGLPEDVFINTLHFSGSAATLDPARVLAAIVNLYNTPPPGNTNNMGKFISAVVSRSEPVQVRFYGVEVGSPSGAPYAEGTFILGAPVSNTPLPEEVALVSSFASTAVGLATVPNKRGRNFVGPLVNTGLSTGPPSRPATVLTASIVASYKEFRAEMNGSSPGGPDKWVTMSVQYSGAPPNRVPSVITTANVVHGWVDNAWDTQRRRGIAPDARTTWT